MGLWSFLYNENLHYFPEGAQEVCPYLHLPRFKREPKYTLINFVEAAKEMENWAVRTRRSLRGAWDPMTWMQKCIRVSTCVRDNAGHEIRHLQIAGKSEICLIFAKYTFSRLKQHPQRTGKFKGRVRRRGLMQFKAIVVVDHCLGGHLEDDLP